MVKFKKSILVNGDKISRIKQNNFKKKRDDAVKMKKNSVTIKDITKGQKIRTNGHQKTDNASSDDLSCLWEEYSPRYSLHVSFNTDWISQLLVEEKEEKPIALPVRRRLKELASTIYNDDLQIYKQMLQRKNERDNKHFHKALLVHGTTKDKVAALAFTCMENPVYTLNDLFSIIDLVNAKCKNTFSSTIDVVLNLFRSTYLTKDRSIAKEFECHSFSSLFALVKAGKKEQAEKALLLWYFEDQIRLAFLKLTENLDKLCHDTQLRIRRKGLKGLECLLREHPDQDVDKTVSLLVNKLGDSNKKVAGDVVHTLSEIQIQSPSIKTSLVSHIEEFLYRPNVSTKSQYYALCFLKDIIFDKGDSMLAKRLIKLYFDFFQSCSKKGEVDSRFMTTLLRGVNRAYPFINDKQEPFFQDQLNILYKLSHLVNFSVATQAIHFLYQVQVSKDSLPSDRYYSLLYGKLMDPCSGISSSCGAFLNVVFKSLVKDKDTFRIYSFLRRLLQVSHWSPSQVTCGILFLISEVTKDNPNLGSAKDALLQLPKRTEKMEKEEPEANKVFDDGDSEDDYEYYPDLDVESGGEEEAVKKVFSESGKSNEISTSSNSKEAPVHSETSTASIGRIKTESSWFHREISNSNKREQPKSNSAPDTYNIMARNPLYSGAHLDFIWELQTFKHHFHPTVSLFASTLLSGQNIIYSGDPLEDFTLTRFLDRFVHRNPKKMNLGKSESSVVFGNRSNYVPEGTRSIPVVSERFSDLNEQDVAPEDRFFFNFFTKYKRRKRTREADEGSSSVVDDDEFDRHLRKMKGFEHIDDISDDDDNEIEDLDFTRHSLPDKDEESDAEFGGEESEVEFEDEGSDTDIEDEESDIEYEDEDEGSDAEFEDEGSEAEFEDEGSEAEYEDESIEGDSDSSEDQLLDMKSKNKPHKRKNVSKVDWSSKLADAEEFSRILEANTDSGDYLAGTSEAISVKEGTHKKQIVWEKKRSEKRKGKKSPKKTLAEKRKKRKLK